MSQRKRQNATKAADKLFADWIKRDGRCWAAGREGLTCSGHLECCHIRSRSYRSGRWAAWNALPMCQAHHVFYTHRPIAWEDAIGPEEWQHVTDLIRTSPPESALDALERLRTMGA